MISASSSMAVAVTGGGEISATVPFAHCGHNARVPISATLPLHRVCRWCHVPKNPRATLFTAAPALSPQHSTRLEHAPTPNPGGAYCTALGFPRRARRVSSVQRAGRRSVILGIDLRLRRGAVAFAGDRAL